MSSSFWLFLFLDFFFLDFFFLSLYPFFFPSLSLRSLSMTTLRNPPFVVCIAIGKCPVDEMNLGDSDLWPNLAVKPPVFVLLWWNESQALTCVGDSSLSRLETCRCIASTTSQDRVAPAKVASKSSSSRRNSQRIPFASFCSFPLGA